MFQKLIYVTPIVSVLGVYSFNKYKKTQPAIAELKDIQNDQFVLLDLKYNQKTQNFIQQLKRQFLEEHYHIIPKEMNYDKPDFYKDYIAIRKIRFKKDNELKDNSQIDQGIVYSFVDTHFGALAAQLYQKRPVVTAHISYKGFEKFVPEKDYYIIAFANNMENRNVYMTGIVLDDQSKKVMELESRFVQVDWKILPKPKTKKSNQKNQISNLQLNYLNVFNNPGEAFFNSLIFQSRTSHN